MKDLVGKVALVTGGGKSVGKEIARMFAHRGAEVIINCFHSYAQAKDTKVELERDTGARIHVIRASVAKTDQVERLFAEVEEHFGGLDILVNNAASGSLGPVTDIRPEHFARALDTNLLGSFWCSVAAAPLMARRGGGTIVNISSIGAGLVPDNYLVVGTSKAAVEALTRHLAADLAQHHIRVNTASCSLIRGDVAKLFPRADELEQVAIACAPLDRMATPEDLVGIVTFLTSDLSSWVTGQVVLADGGASLANAMLSPPRKRLPILPPELNARVAAPTETPQSDSPALPTSAAPQRPEAGPGSVAMGLGRDSGPDRAEANTGQATHEPGENRSKDVAPTDDPVVVVGMGLAVPGANNPEEYWAQQMEGAERFVEAPPDRWVSGAFYSPDPAAEDKAYQRRAGFITGFVPDVALAQEIEDGQVGNEHTTLWLRHCLHQAMRGVRRGDGDRVTFAVGYTADGSHHLEEAVVLDGMARRVSDVVPTSAGEEPDAKNDVLAAYRAAAERQLWRTGDDPASYLPHEVARNAMNGLLPAQTSVFVVDTACSSSLYAIDIGAMQLRLGECDMAVCGGAFALAPRGAVLFSKLHGLSRAGVVRSLDRAADGVLFSDGAGIVVLKRLSRAVADGDHVLGVVRAVGSSSDGKGKAIYAPNPAGQRLAVDRALSASGVVLDDLDWVVAHATGTPAGDLAEFTTLREALPNDRRIWVTSNKSLIGHTGWSAGVVSVVEVLLAIQHGTIPRQHRFESAPDAFRLAETTLQIPTAAVPWPARPNRPRTASVSGFGFGGTNAHVVVEEYIGQRREAVAPAVATERIAIVGWSAQLPGLADSEVPGWLDGQSEPDLTFGDRYPIPPFQRVRIPPSTLRSTDRCQLMLLECTFLLEERLGGLLNRFRATTGVLAGHMGPTRNGVMYALRSYLDPLAEGLADGAARARQAHERVAGDVRSLIPPSNEDSFPGIMPNVIPARVANYFDLHGLNMTVDTGPAATLTAIAAAILYLRSGVLDVALVSGVNGNSTVEIAEVLRHRLPPGTALAEGAVMFALVRESTARTHDLPVLGFVDDYQLSEGPPARAGTVVVGPGTGAPRSYLGADGALGLLKALHADGDEATVSCLEGPGQPVASLRLRKPSDQPSSSVSQSEAGAAPAAVDGPGPGTLNADRGDADRLPPIASIGQAREAAVVRRHTVALRPAPLVPIRRPIAFLPSDTLVLTDDPASVDAVSGTALPMMLSTQPLTRPGPGRVYLPDIKPDTVAAALQGLPAPPRHIRVVTDLTTAVDPDRDVTSRPDGLLALHDLLFLTLQHEADALGRPETSVVVLLLRGVRAGQLHPFAGLFTGLVKAAAFELPQCLFYAVATSSDDPATGIGEAISESRARRLVPMAAYDGGKRLAHRIQLAEPTMDTPRLTETSVVLAVGGSRGITAEVLKALARGPRPTIYVLGSNALDTADEGPTDRESYLRELVGSRPTMTIAEANRVYQRTAQARLARANLDGMSAGNGGRVHYLVGDARDTSAVQTAVDAVLAAEGHVDLLVNAAGVNRSGFLRTKSLADFRAVRDLKVDAYQNLKRAFSGRPPRIWCNFSSLVGFRGQPGEVDYASANDFLSAASCYSALACGQDEYAIGWNLWRDVGLGADPLLRSLLERLYRFSPMSTEEGVAHFLAELDQPEHDPYVLLMGDAELGELGLSPGQVTEGAPASLKRRSDATPGVVAATPGDVMPMLGQGISRFDTEMVVDRVFDLDHDTYLVDHRVGGVPTMPGTFLAEMAAEAAGVLEPRRVIVSIRDLVFSSFLKVRPGRPVAKRIRGRVLSRDERQTVVAVSVTTDVVAPGGQQLALDRPHFSAVVHLADVRPLAPRWEPWATGGDHGAADEPYHVPNPAIQLTGIFVASREHRLHAQGRRATLDLRLPSADAGVRGFVLPAVLLDALLRVGMLDEVGDGYHALAAPTAIRRIDLYGSGNDHDLAAAHPTIDLYSVPPRSDQTPDGRRWNRGVAATPDGRVLVRVDDATTAILGYVNPRTGDYRAASQPPVQQSAGHRSLMPTSP